MTIYFRSIFTIFLFLIHLSPTSAFHRIDDILNNLDIIWAAETYTDYAPNISSSKLGKKEILKQYGLSRNIPISLKTKQKISDKPETTLAFLISKYSRNNHIKLFKNSDLKKKLRHNEYTKLLLEKKVDLNTIKLFRVKQILYFNKKSNQLELTPIAIAPIHCTHNDKGQLENTVPLFWVSITEVAQTTDFNSGLINWAKQITRTIDSQDLKIIKGKDQLGDILIKIFSHDIKHPEDAEIYNQNQRRLTVSELKKYSAHGIKSEAIQQIRIIQNWVWSKKKQALSLHLTAIAPIVKRYDMNDNYLNSGPLFFKYLKK